MKQFKKLRLVLGQMLCVVILIVSVAWPAACQEMNDQKAELVVQTGHPDGAGFISFSLDGKYLALSHNFSTKLWNIATGQEIRTLDGGEARFSPDGKTLATSKGTSLKLWNWRTGQELRTLQSSSLVPTRMASFSPKGDVLASFGYTANTIWLWDVKSGKQLRVLAGHTSMISSVVFSPDGKTLASDSANGPIKLWNWHTGEQLRTIDTSASPFSSSLTFSPNGEMIASRGVADGIALWDVATGQKLRKVGDILSSITYSLAFCQGGKALAILGSEFQYTRNRAAPMNPSDIRAAMKQRTFIKLIDVQTGQELREIELDIKTKMTRQLLEFQFSPDDKTIAIIGVDRNPKLLDATDWTGSTNVRRIHSASHSTGSSVDGSLFASGSADGSIRLWDSQRGRQIRTLKDHDSPIEQIVFSQDSRTLVSKTEEVIKLWDVETGRLLKSLPISDPTTQRQVETVVPAFYQSTPYETVMGKFRLFKGENGKLNIHDENHLVKVSVVSLNENDWAAITPEGLFDASPGARKLMHYVTGLEPVQLEQMKDAYYVPGLLQKIFKGIPAEDRIIFQRGPFPAG